MSKGATVLDAQDFRHFSREAKRLLALARILGWDLRWLNSQRKSASMRSPGGEKAINIPTTSMNANRVRSNFRSIVRHTPTDAILAFINGDLDLTKESEDVQTLIATLGTDLINVLRIELQTPEPERTPAQPEPEPAPVEPEPAPVETKPAPVEAEPASRRNPLGTKAARKMERIVDADGGVTYRCKWEDCGFTNQSEMGMIAHYNKHTGVLKRREPYAPPRRVVATEPVVVTSNRHGEKRAESRFCVRVLLDDGSTTFKCPVCDYMNDNSRSVSMHAKAHPELHRQPAKQDPVTKDAPAPVPGAAVAEQVLTQIRTLLGHDPEVEALRAERDEWRAKAESLQQNLSALRDLLRGVDA